MNRKRVDSTSIRSVGYDEATQTLEVEFVGGGVYEYLDVPRSEFERFMSASSLGAYLNTQIKGEYEVQRIS